MDIVYNTYLFTESAHSHIYMYILLHHCRCQNILIVSWKSFIGLPMDYDNI